MQKAALGAGFTLLEILIVLGILGILMGIGAYSYFQAINPPREVARTVHSKLIQVRTDARANTQARRVLLTGQNLTLQSAVRCSESDPSRWSSAGAITFDGVQRSHLVTLSTASATGTPDPSLPAGAKLVVCFTSRGLAQPPAGQTLAALVVSDSRRTFNVEVALGGAVRTRVP